MTLTTLSTIVTVSLEISLIFLVILMLRIRKMKRLLSDYENKQSTNAQTPSIEHKKEVDILNPTIEEKIVSNSIDSSREQIYIARIKNLEKFKEMYISRLEESQKLFSRIETLSQLANTSPAPELSDLQFQINKLESEKHELKKSLKGLLDLLDQKTKENEVFEHEQYKKLKSLTEENEFLTVQIQYLLKQEVETTNNLMMKIKHLEDTLAAIEHDAK